MYLTLDRSQLRHGILFNGCLVEGRSPHLGRFVFLRQLPLERIIDPYLVRSEANKIMLETKTHIQADVCMGSFWEALVIQVAEAKYLLIFLL